MKGIIKNIFCFLLLTFNLLVLSCSSSNIFPDIGTNLSGPMALITDSASNRLYVVNSNNNVLYKTGSFQVLNITTPTAPSLITNGTTVLSEFSGQAYLDLAGKNIYLTNRLSENNQDNIDNILTVNIDESSASFLNVASYADGANPFGLTYDLPTGTFYVAAYLSSIDYFPIGSPQNISVISLANLALSDGTTLVSSSFRELAIVGRMAFVSRTEGGLLVVDLTENNADYYVNDFIAPSGINYDGTYVYLADTENVGGTDAPMLFAINPAAFPAVTGNTTVQVKSRTDAGVVAASPAVGNNPQEVVYSTNYLFVTNFNDNTVTVIDRPALTVNKTIAVGEEPFGMAVYSPGGTDAYLYLSNMFSNTISIINLNTLVIDATYP